MTMGSLSGGYVSKASFVETVIELFAHILYYDEALRASLGRNIEKREDRTRRERQDNAADGGLLKDYVGGASKKTFPCSHEALLDNTRAQAKIYPWPTRYGRSGPTGFKCRRFLFSDGKEIEVSTCMTDSKVIG